MNTSPKVLLTINLEGGTLIKGTPEVRKYYLTKKDMFPKQKFKGNEGNKIIKSGKYTYVPTRPSEAKKKIVLCKDAYDYMTSSACPEWFKNQKIWRKMPTLSRLEAHLYRTTEHYRGLSFSYQILEDE